MFYGDLMGIHGIFHGIYWDLPGLVNIQKVIEHGPVEIVDLPEFPIANCWFTRG